MPPAARTELAPGVNCRNCGQALPPGKSVCPSCGAAHGASNQCPHCDALTDVEPHRALGFRCLVCGGPRIALDMAGVELGTRARAALTSAGSEQTKHVMLTAAGLLLSSMGGLALLIATAVVLTVSPGVVAALASYLAASVPLFAGAFALVRAGTARMLRDEALRTAQISALVDVQAVTGVLDAARVAELMRLTPERAELLLAEASIATLLNEAPPPRVRIDAAPSPATADATEVTEPEQPPTRTARADTEI